MFAFVLVVLLSCSCDAFRLQPAMISATPNNPSKNSTCKSTSDLEKIFARLISVPEQDISGAQEAALEAWGCPEKTDCRICDGECAFNEELVVRREGLDKWDISDCAKFDVRGTVSELKLLGAISGPLQTEPCKSASMKEVAKMHISLVRALGVKTLHVSDAARFAQYPCSPHMSSRQMRVVTYRNLGSLRLPMFHQMKYSPSPDGVNLEASVLKLATKGRTLYQDFYGDSFLFSPRNLSSTQTHLDVQEVQAMCQMVCARFNEISKEEGLDKVAEEVLEFTKEMSKKDVLDLRQEDADACKPFHEKFKKIKEKLPYDCAKCYKDFEVTVDESTPSC